MNWCGLTRLRITLAADREDSWPAGVGRHLSRCPACRRFADTQRSLGECLRTEAASINESAPPFLRARIVARLEDDEIGHGFALSRLLTAPVALALGVGAIAAVLVVLHPSITGPAGPTGTHAPETASSVATTLVLPASDEFLRLGESLDAPLHRELEWLVRDAETAVRGLARNFGPEVLSD